MRSCFLRSFLRLRPLAPGLSPAGASSCIPAGVTCNMPTAGRSSIWATRRGSCSTVRRAKRRASISKTAPGKGSRSYRPSASRNVTGLRVPNAYGDLPFADAGFTRPNERYFAYVDEVVAMADSLGLLIGLLPAWGDKFCLKWGPGPEIFTTEGRAEAFGRYLGERYRIRRNIIWILGGDRPPEGREPILRAFARGIACGVAGREDYSACLITYHPWGKSSSGDWLHDEPWLAFNMRRRPCLRFDLWSSIARDYARAARQTRAGRGADLRGTSDRLRPGKIRHFRSPACAAGVLPRGLFRGLRTYLRLSCRMADVGTRPVCACHGARAELAGISLAARGLPGVLWAGTYREPSVFPPYSRPGRYRRGCRPGAPGVVRLPATASAPMPWSIPRADGRLPSTWNGFPGSGSWPGGTMSGSGRPLRIGEFRRRDAGATMTFTPPTCGKGNDWVLVLDDARMKYPPPGRCPEARSGAAGKSASRAFLSGGVQGFLPVRIVSPLRALFAYYDDTPRTKPCGVCRCGVPPPTWSGIYPAS